MKIERDRKLEINNYEIVSLKLLTRITLQEEIDEEMIDLIRELQLEYESLMNKYVILEERVNIDDKTSLLKYNETFLVNIVKAISRYWQTSQKTHQMPITYIRLDLDDFSKVNNRYGHAAGDRVLVEVASLIKKLSRPTDYIFRFGGEEFDIVLPVTPLEGAKVYLEKVIDGLHKLSIRLETGESIKITASLGYSSFNLDLDIMKTIMGDEIILRYRQVQNEADYACYHAKFLGKDRFCLYDPTVDYKSIMREYSTRV